MKSERPCILIYNPISGHGHLDSWNSLFVGILLERGFHVLCLTPDEARLERYLAEKGFAGGGRAQVLPWDVPGQLQEQRTCEHDSVQQGHDSRHGAIPSGLERLIKGLLKLGRGGVRRLRSVVRRSRHEVRRGLHRVKVLLGMPDESGYLCPGDMARRIAVAMPDARVRPDFLFVMYMDMFKTCIRDWKPLGKLVGLPWGGIRFAPHVMKEGKLVEAYYRLSGLKGMCLLDEAACRRHKDALPTKVFQCLPDITYSSLPEREPKLVAELRARAAGRKVVFLGGSLDSRKNISGFSRLARMADPARWFFALVGRVYRDSLSNEDKRELDGLADHDAGNVFLHMDFIDDEREFNAMMHASDILFAVYTDFPYSSNMLSKAANLRRPILVSDRYLMGELVQRYGIGIAVPESDPSAAYLALEKLRTHSISEESYANYCENFSAQSLGDALEHFICRCLKICQ